MITDVNSCFETDLELMGSSIKFDILQLCRVTIHIQVVQLLWLAATTVAPSLNLWSWEM